MKKFLDERPVIRAERLVNQTSGGVQNKDEICTRRTSLPCKIRLISFYVTALAGLKLQWAREVPAPGPPLAYGATLKR